MDGFDGSIVAQRNDAAGLARGDLLVLCVNAAVEVIGLTLEAVFVGTALAGAPLISPAGTAKRGLQRWQQEEREVWLKVAAHGMVHSEDSRAAKATATALIGLG